MSHTCPPLCQGGTSKALTARDRDYYLHSADRKDLVTCSRSWTAQASEFLWLSPPPAGGPQQCLNLLPEKFALAAAVWSHTSPWRCSETGRNISHLSLVRVPHRHTPRPYRMWLNGSIPFKLDHPRHPHIPTHTH